MALFPWLGPEPLPSSLLGHRPNSARVEDDHPTTIVIHPTGPVLSPFHHLTEEVAVDKAADGGGGGGNDPNRQGVPPFGPRPPPAPSGNPGGPDDPDDGLGDDYFDVDDN